MPRLPVSPTADTRPDSSPIRRRLPHLDRLKVAFVAVIIAVHAVLGYTSLDGPWPYENVQETRLAPAAEIAFGAVALPGASFALGLFFLISGLLTPASLDAKGPARFARDRLARLGVPLAVFVVMIWPGSIALTYELAGYQGSYWRELVGSRPPVDTGPMWFVAVLLLYSLVYAAWRGSVRRHAPESRRRRQGGTSGAPARILVVLALAVSFATVAIRLVFPFASGQVGQAHLWQWPQYVALFGLGVAAARNGWLDPVPAGVQRGAGLAALAAFLGFLALVAGVLAAGLDPYVLFAQQPHWAPLTMAALEGPLAVGASVWLLGTAQRHFGGPLGDRERVVASSAFAAYVIQAPVLLGLAVALRPAGLPAEAKAIAVAVAGVAASFALARLLVSRTPVGRVL